MFEAVYNKIIASADVTTMQTDNYDNINKIESDSFSETGIYQLEEANVDETVRYVQDAPKQAITLEELSFELEMESLRYANLLDTECEKRFR